MAHLQLSPPFAALGQRIVKAPKLVLAGIVVLTAVFGAAASTIQFNNSNDIFFVEDDPLLVAHKRFEKRFGSDEFVMVFVEGDLYTPEAFRAVNTLVKQMEQITFEGEKAFTAVLTPFHAPTVRDVGGSIQIAPLLADQDDPSAEDLARAKKDATEHPVYKDLIVNRDGTAGAVVGTIRAMDDDNAYQAFLADEMERIVDTEGLKALDALLVGNPIFKKQMDSATAEEAAVFGSAAILVCIIALLLIFRRKRQVAAAVSVVVLAVVWTIGIMALLGFEMSLVSIILPLAVVIMGLGSGVHIINEFREQRHRGARRSEAVVQAVGLMGMPAFLTALTTAIGFLSMLSAPVVPMRELGIFASVGVMCAWSLAVTLVPAVLALGDDAAASPEENARFAREHRTEAAFNRAFGRVGDVIVSRAALVSLGFFALSVLAAYGLRFTVVESHMIQAFRPDQPFRQAVEHVDKRLGGSTSLELVVDSGVPGGVYDPGFLQRMATLQSWIMETQGDVVGSVLSLPDLLREINFAFTGKRDLPDSRERTAQLMLLYESGDGDTRIVIDHSARFARMNIRTRQTTTTRSLELEAALLEKAEALFADWQQPALPQAEAAVEPPPPAAAPAGDDEIIIIDDDDDFGAAEPSEKKAAASPPADDEDIIVIEDDDDFGATRPPVAASAVDVERAVAQKVAPERAEPTHVTSNEEPPLAAGASRIELAGTSQLFVHLAEYVIDSQISSFSLAALLITVLMILTLRSARLGLAAMIPNLLPIVATYGIMGWTGVAVDWLTALIGVAALGVAVDGTIHMGTRYRLNRAAGLEAPEAARNVLTTTGRAILVTGSVLVAGFMVVTPSILASLASFGLLMALCLLLAMVFDLLMTPAMFAWLAPPANMTSTTSTKKDG